MKNRNEIIGFVLILLLIFATFNVFRDYISKPRLIKTDTVLISDTVYKDTMIVLKKDSLIPKFVYVLKKDTFYTNEGKDTTLIFENKTYVDSLCVQNDTAIVTNYISGVNAKLDSTKIQLKKTKEIITNTVTVTKYIQKPKTLKDYINVGIGVGYGYGLNSKQFEPVIGIGIGVNL